MRAGEGWYTDQRGGKVEGKVAEKQGRKAAVWGQSERCIVCLPMLELGFRPKSVRYTRTVQVLLIGYGATEKQSTERDGEGWALRFGSGRWIAAIPEDVFCAKRAAADGAWHVC